MADAPAVRPYQGVIVDVVGRDSWPSRPPPSRCAMADAPAVRRYRVAYTIT